MNAATLKEIAEKCQALVRSKCEDGQEMMLKLIGAADGVNFLYEELAKVVAAESAPAAEAAAPQLAVVPDAAPADAPAAPASETPA